MPLCYIWVPLISVGIVYTMSTRTKGDCYMYYTQDGDIFVRFQNKNKYVRETNSNLCVFDIGLNLMVNLRLEGSLITRLMFTG